MQYTNECDVNPLFKGNNSGIDPQRLEGNPPHPMMLCQSCGKTFWNPLTCSDMKCAATYCEPCLHQHFKKEEICPNARITPSLIYPPLMSLIPFNLNAEILHLAPKLSLMASYPFISAISIRSAAA